MKNNIYEDFLNSWEHKTLFLQYFLTVFFSAFVASLSYTFSQSDQIIVSILNVAGLGYTVLIIGIFKNKKVFYQWLEKFTKKLFINILFMIVIILLSMPLISFVASSFNHMLFLFRLTLNNNFPEIQLLPIHWLIDIIINISDFTLTLLIIAGFSSILQLSFFLITITTMKKYFLSHKN